MNREINFESRFIMFQVLQNKNSVDYGGESELGTFGEIIGHRDASSIFGLSAMDEIANNLEPMCKMPNACSKMQLLSKEVKFQGIKEIFLFIGL